MPDYAPNYTARLKVRYRAAGANHSQTFRCNTLGALFATVDELIVGVQAYYDAIGPVLYEDAEVLTVTVAEQNVDVFIPHGTLTLTGASPLLDAGDSIKAGAFSFVGTSGSGGRAIVFQYGAAFSPSGIGVTQDFRITAAEDADISAAIDALNATTIMVANDGAGITWAPYANFKYMDYWMKRVRQGS